jgi:hypothetical protein
VALTINGNHSMAAPTAAHTAEMAATRPEMALRERAGGGEEEEAGAMGGR